MALSQREKNAFAAAWASVWPIGIAIALYLVLAPLLAGFALTAEALEQPFHFQRMGYSIIGAVSLGTGMIHRELREKMHWSMKGWDNRL